jgi:outer membrane beta-barrel protein
METGIRVFLLNRMLPHLRALGIAVSLACALSGCGLFGGNKEPPPLGTEGEKPAPEANEQPVINPEVTRRKIKVPKIKNEDFEIGPYIGILSIEDFGSHSVYGARLAYHITEDFFLEGVYGLSKGGTTSYERLSGGPKLLSDDDRRYTYYALNAGWNALPGEIFIGTNRAYNTNFYVTVGIGGTKFAKDNRFTANAGLGYRILLNRWIAAHFDFRDYLFDIDLLGEKKVAHNLEGSLGLTVFF